MRVTPANQNKSKFLDFVELVKSDMLLVSLISVPIWIYQMASGEITYKQNDLAPMFFTIIILSFLVRCAPDIAIAAWRKLNTWRVK